MYIAVTLTRAKCAVLMIRRGHPNALAITRNIAVSYNCHGLCFASRRAIISEPSEVEKILNDDNYQKINIAQILPGDIIIYRSKHDRPLHSAIFVEAYSNNNLYPKVISKWGPAGKEVVHHYHDCPYPTGNIEFRRFTP